MLMFSHMVQVLGFTMEALHFVAALHDKIRMKIRVNNIDECLSELKRIGATLELRKIVKRLMVLKHLSRSRFHVVAVELSSVVCDRAPKILPSSNRSSFFIATLDVTLSLPTPLAMMSNTTLAARCLKPTRSPMVKF